VELKELQKNWNEFGETDALWAILTEPGKRNCGWDPEAFFKTGRDEIAAVMAYVDSLGVRFPRRRALDFGCGVGRLTQALCQYFDSCCGVDIAPSMLRLANEYNRHGSRCAYHLNEANDLALFPDDRFDFVYSIIVLQHMRPEYSKNYIKEFIRVLAPQGLLVFQMPSGLIGSAAAATPAQPAAQALPPSGFKARLRPHQSSLTARAGGPVSVTVTVRNISDCPWPGRTKYLASCPVMLGNHWLDEAGRVLVLDDARARLPHDLAPGEEAEVSLAATCPGEPGDYVLELDMVQEMIAWFKDRGSEPARVRVRVTEGAGAGAAVMEMYGVPKEEVLGCVNDAGGKVVAVQETSAAGPEWVSYSYCVTKR
jgi:SAM-dependent methyltransferase